MARFIYQNHIMTGDGKIVEGATVTVYLADTTTPATIRTAKSGGSTITGAAITTDEDGYYKFYVDDGDHSTAQLFDIVVTKTGYISKTYEDVGISPGNGDIINVRDYGASPSATAAVNDAAFLEAIAAGDHIYVPPGTYSISTGLVLAAGQVLHGAGMRVSTLSYTGTSGYAATFGSTSSSSLSYGCGVRDLAIILTANGGNGIRLAGTAGAYIENVYMEGIPSTNTSIGVYLDGANAANIFTTMSNVIANHFKFGYELNSSGSSVVTSATLTNCEAFGDLTSGSIGFNLASGNSDGVRIIGGNAEDCVQGIKSAGTGVSVFGLRFEGNTTDVRLEATSQANSFIACQNLATISDASGHVSNSFLANQTSGASPAQGTNKLEQLTVLGNTTLLKNDGSNRVIILSDTTTGSLLIQGGPNSAALGGSILLRGSGHAGNGSVIAGLGGTGARSFSVNSQALGGGTNLFSVDDGSILTLGSNHMIWAAAAPTTGTWARGDVTWNTGAAAGGSPGWVCTTAGTPGTWKTMANVAA